MPWNKIIIQYSKKATFGGGDLHQKYTSSRVKVLIIYFIKIPYDFSDLLSEIPRRLPITQLRRNSLLHIATFCNYKLLHVTT